MDVLFIFLSVGSFLLYQGTSGVDIEEVFVKEGDSVTLHTGVKKTQQDVIMWYFKDIRIARINGDPSKICTDVQCDEGTERFRDRLKLDNQTGSLTIMNTRTTDAGLYKVLINSDREKIFIVTVHEVKEGDSVILHTDVKKNPEDSIMWYFNDIRIARINGDPNKTCTDVQCNEVNERFRDRLKLDHQTGSLTIMNTRTTDSGLYKLLINSDREKIFRVTVHDSGLSPAVPHSGLSPAVPHSGLSPAVPHSGLSPAVPDSGLSPGFAAGISITALLVSVAVAAVIYYRHKRFRNDKGGKQQGQCLKKSINEVRSLMTVP